MKITHQGAVSVSHLYAEPRETLLVHVDLHTKYADASAVGGATPPEIHLYANDESLHLEAGVHRDAPTSLVLNEFPGWEAYKAWVGRYTLTVVLVKP